MYCVWFILCSWCLYCGTYWRWSQEWQKYVGAKNKRHIAEKNNKICILLVYVWVISSRYCFVRIITGLWTEFPIIRGSVFSRGYPPSPNLKPTHPSFYYVGGEPASLDLRETREEFHLTSIQYIGYEWIEHCLHSPLCLCVLDTDKFTFKINKIFSVSYKKSQVSLNENLSSKIKQI